MKSTYDIEAFQNSDDEMARLERQAGIALEFECATLKSFGLGEGQAVLDVGAGPGIVSQALAGMVGETGRVLGIDNSPPMVTRAQERARGVTDGAQVTQLHHDVLTAPLPDEHGLFDFAYCRFVCQHVSDHERLLRNVTESLRPGGTLCAVDVDADWLCIYPELPALQEVFDLATEEQAAWGGDRRVGRKLRHTFQAIGLQEVRGGVIPLTTSELGVEPLLDLVTGYKARFLADRGVNVDPATVRQAVQLAAKDPQSWGAIGLFYAVGQRP